MGVWFENYAQGEFSILPLDLTGIHQRLHQTGQISRRKKWGSTLWGLPSLTSGFMSHNGVLHILRRVLMLLEVCKVRFYNLHRTFVTLTLQSGVDMKTASGILGRYSAGFTLDTYPYVTTAAQKTTEKIINILKS